MADCKHETFQASVVVNRLQLTENGPVTHYSADVTVKCKDCGLEFEWCGVP